jgi:phosphatidate cytidylyltransferase
LKNTFLIRTLVALPLLMIFVMLIIFQNWWFKIAITLLLLLSQHEINKAVKTRVENLNMAFTYIFVLLIPIVAYTVGLKYIWVIYLIAFVYLMVEVVMNKQRDIGSFASNLLTLLYPSVLFASLFAINITFDVNMSRLIIFMAFFIAMVTDTFAYIFGSLLGKRKLCEHISPKKSVEGAVFGYLFGLIATVMIGLFMQKLFSVDIPIINFVILGFILPALVQIGDLFASMIKRYYGIKDFGTIFPGHGGFMDRLDSSLFVFPVVYLYFVFIYAGITML